MSRAVLQRRVNSADFPTKWEDVADLEEKFEPYLPEEEEVDPVCSPLIPALLSERSFRMMSQINF